MTVFVICKYDKRYSGSDGGFVVLYQSCAFTSREVADEACRRANDSLHSRFAVVEMRVAESIHEVQLGDLMRGRA